MRSAAFGVNSTASFYINKAEGKRGLLDLLDELILKIYDKLQFLCVVYFIEGQNVLAALSLHINLLYDITPLYVTAFVLGVLMVLK